MAYRRLPPPPRPERRTFEKVATPAKVYMHNGQVANIALPCWYMDPRWPVHHMPHDREHDDFMGWPNPDDPDGICQATHFEHLAHWHHDLLDEVPAPDDEPGWHLVVPRLDLSRVIPIHLPKEGYDAITVTLARKVDGLSASGRIDQQRDWVIRVRFDAMADEAQLPTDRPLEVPFSVTAHAKAMGSLPERRDTALMGVLCVVPAVISSTKEA